LIVKLFGDRAKIFISSGAVLAARVGLVDLSGWSWWLASLLSLGCRGWVAEVVIASFAERAAELGWTFLASHAEG
jgi:hypothetical protein